MRRRDFIMLFSGTAGWQLLRSWPVLAQQPRLIGVLMAYTEGDPTARIFIAAFLDTLAKLGWQEGRNLRIEYRWASTDEALTERSAKELVALQPDLILSSGTSTTAALHKLTKTIPIIFGIAVDPVGQGFVASLAKPGGNITGFINLEGSISGRQLELLKEIAPAVTRVAMYFNPGTAPYSGIYIEALKAAAASIGVEPIVAPIHDMTELEAVMVALARGPSGGLIAMPDPFNIARRVDVTALAARYRLPAIYSIRQFPDVGGLISYGSDNVDNYRRAASYADRILRGDKPAELPVQIPTKFELVINRKTANALGLRLPPTMLTLADEVIE
jgi:putative ABC transport system substrate-binding protein